MYVLPQCFAFITLLHSITGYKARRSLCVDIMALALPASRLRPAVLRTAAINVTPAVRVSPPPQRLLCVQVAQVAQVASRRTFVCSSSRPSANAPAVKRGADKVYESADEAVADLKSGSTILSSGFGLCGVAG